MPPNNSNSTSALSRQMQRLRLQMDLVDRKILQLLQQRTRIAGKIGAAKRRHGADVYVPEREREVRARVTYLSRGKLSPRAVTAIYREILSSSRAAQGQAPIGLLRASAKTVIPAARWCFGACDDFLPKAAWRELAAGLQSGSLILALLTGDELARVLRAAPGRTEFLRRFAVAGDFSPVPAGGTPLAQRIFVVLPRGKGASGTTTQILILIECKFTVNAVKSLLHFMPDHPIHAESLPLRPHAALARLTLARPVESVLATSLLLAASKSAGLSVSILGLYPGTEDYGG
jgi:chorismate mutase